MDDANDSGPPRMAWAFGLAGLIPFFGLSALTVLSTNPFLAPIIYILLLAYGAVILSFIGGCRWGFSSAGYGPGPSAVAMSIAVAPSLYVLIAPLIAGWIEAIQYGQSTPASASVALALGHLLMLLEDRRATRAGWTPAWWFTLRLPLASGAALALLLPVLFQGLGG